MTLIAIGKGWFYVIITALSLYWLIERGIKEIEQNNKEILDGEEKIIFQAYHDALTRLPNRVYFAEQLDEAMNAAKENDSTGAVLFLDLDLFKNINDSLGHAIGDLLLIAVAKRLFSIVGDKAVISRMGGDEFAILHYKIENVREAEAFAERIIHRFKDAFIIEGYELFVTASIGICIFPDDGKNFTALIKNADTAMYQAKQLGRNGCKRYDSEMNARSTRRMLVESNLRKALERNELLLHYQPQIDFITQRILGVEALLRWQNKEIGAITPLEFIPIAEETGMILPIGEWVIRTACMQNQAWIKAGYQPIRVSVNVSIRQLYLSNFFETIENILKETGMNAELLTVEITESSLMLNAEECIRILNKLKNLGIQISIDDFGIGYSSLSYLQRLPIDILKIDRSFVKDVPDDKDMSTIAETIIHMAHCLDLQVIAEGIETQEQLNFFKLKGCNEMQGFLFSKPVYAADMEKLLQCWNIKGEYLVLDMGK
jgi:diguanylate cyclase (GGDEF)-like protein